MTFLYRGTQEVRVYKGPFLASIQDDEGKVCPCDLDKVDTTLESQGYVRKWRKKEGDQINEKWIKEN